MVAVQECSTGEGHNIGLQHASTAGQVSGTGGQYMLQYRVAARQHIRTGAWRGGGGANPACQSGY